MASGRSFPGRRTVRRKVAVFPAQGVSWFGSSMKSRKLRIVNSRWICHPPVTVLQWLMIVCVWSELTLESTSDAQELTPRNTQPDGGAPLPPWEAVKRLRVPDGFRVTLAASEPDVQQPIAVTFDDRGRLWVAESYSYDGSSFTDGRQDRI